MSAGPDAPSMMTTMHDASSTMMHDTTPATMQDAAPTMMHDTPSTMMHDAPSTMMHNSPPTMMHNAAPTMMHNAPLAMMHDAPPAMMHSAPSMAMHDSPSTMMHAAMQPTMMHDAVPMNEKHSTTPAAMMRASTPRMVAHASDETLAAPAQAFKLSGFEHRPEAYGLSRVNGLTTQADKPSGMQGTMLPAYFVEDKPEGYYERYPNRWALIREYIREPAAEMIATMVFVLCGLSVNCQALLSQDKKVSELPFGSFISIPFGWSLGAACAVWIAGGISGSHINPAGTIAAAVYRGFPWKKVPIFIFAQLLGGFFAGLFTYANYYHAIDVVEGVGIRTVPGTAAVFTAYAAEFTPDANAFFNEALMSGVLIMVVFAVTDKNNAPPPVYVIPLAIFAAVFCLISGFALNSGFTLDPARDFGPRLATSFFYGSEVWSFRHQYWLWCCWGGPVVGALVGGGLYDLLLNNNPEVLVNRKGRAAKRWALARQFTADQMQTNAPQPPANGA